MFFNDAVGCFDVGFGRKRGLKFGNPSWPAGAKELSTICTPSGRILNDGGISYFSRKNLGNPEIRKFRDFGNNLLWVYITLYPAILEVAVTASTFLAEVTTKNDAQNEALRTKLFRAEVSGAIRS